MKSWKKKAAQVDHIQRQARDIHNLMQEQKIFGANGKTVKQWRRIDLPDGLYAQVYEGVKDPDTGEDKSFARIFKSDTNEEVAALHGEDFEKLLEDAMSAGLL